MFYQEGLGEELRFGDIVRGFVLTNAVLTKTHWSEPSRHYNVNVSLPELSVIMTPCCSIEDKTIAVTPLISVPLSFYDNPYLEEDLTRVNRIMSPQQSVPPQIWNQLGDEERQRRIDEGNTFAFASLFVYDKHASLPQYELQGKRGHTIKQIATGYYMIDFKDIVKVNCDKIISPSDSPLESRYLELSVETREELRTKLGWYYSRRPKEDEVLLDIV